MVTFAPATAGLTDAQVEAIRKAHVQAWSDTGIYRVDSSEHPTALRRHPTLAAGFTTLGQRCAQAVLHALRVASSSRGPSIASVAQVSSTAFDVNLALRGSATDFALPQRITGFRALVGGIRRSPVTIDSVARQSATKVRITLSSAPASMPTVDYLYGAAPTITGVVKDNSSLTLPLEYNSGVLAVAAATAVTLTLTTDGTTPAASLTGLQWAFFDQVTPNLFAAPVAQGAVESTDGSGVLVLDITGSALAPGAVGWLVITNSDGTTTQSPAHKLFAGPVTVSWTWPPFTSRPAHRRRAASMAIGLSPQYTGTVDGLTFASQLSTAAGTYTAPGAPACNGTVDGLIFASALSTVAGSYAAPGDVPPSALPRYTITAKRRRLEIRA